MCVCVSIPAAPDGGISNAECRAAAAAAGAWRLKTEDWLY